MGFEPTNLRDLVGCSNHWATGDSMVSKGQFFQIKFANGIANLQMKTCKENWTTSVLKITNAKISFQKFKIP